MIKYKAKNSLKSPRFAGVKTFMRMEHVVTTDDIDFAVVGIPYDTCASFRVGTRLGPAATRDASALAAKPFNGPLNVGIFDWCSGVDYGDLGSVPGYIEESFELITEGMLPFFEKGIVPVAMGGDHSVTLPELRACAKVNGPVEGLVDTSKSIQVGIREGLYGPEDLTNSTDLGYQVLRADECHKMGMEAVLKAIRARVGSAKAFLTFDIDFLDPAYAPGTGTPVPGGFTTAQTLELVRGLADLNIVGYDVVEVSPPYDPTGITSIAAAGLMQEFISHVAYKKKNGIVF